MIPDMVIDSINLNQIDTFMIIQKTDMNERDLPQEGLNCFLISRHLGCIL